MNTKITKNNSGISILEVVVAIMIIALGLVGILSLVIQNVEAQYINKNVLVAAGLAQEGLEQVRNIRDFNWLTEGNNWKLGDGVDLNTNIVQDGEYAIDYNKQIFDIDNINDARLYVNGDGYYTNTAAGNTPTNFYRLITVVDNTTYLDVKCSIRWQDGTQNHDYEAETYLYNWR